MMEATPFVSEINFVLDLVPSRRRRGRFIVVCPTYNRCRTLPRALDSLLAQSYEEWQCLILDDGSKDGTSDVGNDYARRDPRFVYVRFAANRGGVAMNEIGMRAACEIGDYWSRLGSDDWFEPHKLLVDYVTLGRNELPACFGPYRCIAAPAIDRIWYRLRVAPLRTSGRVVMTLANAAIRGELLRKLRHTVEPDERLASPPMDARAALLASRFAMSWANAAIRTDVLRKVRDRFGGFCDLRSRNMEDFHCNARVASVSNIVWRGLKKDEQTVVIGAQTWTDAGGESEFVYDGIWHAAADGASNNREQVDFDARVTRAAIQADFSRHPPEPCAAVEPRVVRL